jgi:GNAT superfamily N-acetyltransferase
MNSQYHISLITTAETFPLRQKVLKPFLTLEECINPGDDLPSTYHFGLFHTQKLISIATFISESFPAFDAGNPYRLRGMATDDRYRRQGFGQILTRQSLEFLKTNRCDLVWCNARLRAFPFYERLGFLYYGELFELPQIGPHKVMYKRVIPR